MLIIQCVTRKSQLISYTTQTIIFKFEYFTSPVRAPQFRMIYIYCTVYNGYYLDFFYIRRNIQITKKFMYKSKTLS